MAHDHSMCPGANPEEKEWTEKQAVETGSCNQCGKIKPLRYEPYSMTLMCKEDWELIVYGDED